MTFRRNRTATESFALPNILILFVIAMGFVNAFAGRNNR